MPGKRLFLATTIALALGIGAEAWRFRDVRGKLAIENRRIALLESQGQAARERLRESLEQELAAKEKILKLLAAAPAKAAQEALAKTLWDRIEAVRQRLREMPSENIPELKMLGMKDWIDAVLSADTTNDAQLKVLFLSLRSTARTQFAEKLHDALQRFTQASGGELPANTDQLLPYLDPPADSTMLARYALTRSGKTGANDEELIALKSPDADGTVSVSLGGWGSKTNSDYMTKVTEGVDLSDMFGSTETALGEDSDAKILETAVKTIGPELEKAFAPISTDDFGDRLKAAVKQFSVDHEGVSPTDLFQLRSYLPEADQFAELARPAIAQLEYLLDHSGKPSDNSAQMQRYLERATDAERTLRAMKLTVTEESINVTFKLLQ